MLFTYLKSSLNLILNCLLKDELSAVYPNISGDGTIKFSIVSQPETQHRARYVICMVPRASKPVV